MPQFACAPHCNDPLPGQIARDNLFAGKIILALVLAVLFLAIIAWRRRRQIAAAADTAVVSTLASAVRAKRNVSSRLAQFGSRVREKADH